MKKSVEPFYYLLHPRPVVLICCGNEKTNVMACSWIMPVSEEPPMIAISIWKESYTHELIEKQGEFTVNIPSLNLIKQVWIAGTKSGRDADKISLTSLKISPSKKLKTPIVEDCIGHLECRLNTSISAGECTIFIANVLEAYAEEELIEKNIWREKANLLLHSGGKNFAIPKKVSW